MAIMDKKLICWSSNFPISINRIGKKYRDLRNTKNLRRSGSPLIDDETKLGIILDIIEDTHNLLQITTFVMYIKKVKYHPYKIKLVHDIDDDDLDRTNNGGKNFFFSQ